MRGMIIVALLVLMPMTVFADALATRLAVFDAATLRTMTTTGDVSKVADGDLFTKSIFHTYFGSKGKGKDDVTGDFTWDKKEYRVLVGRRKTKTIYTILLITADQPTQVVAVGEIHRLPLTKEIKDDAKGDPFVVVVRSGNYARH
jgi:hypothetical protein